jgi:exodeoxyribonuclease-5
LEREVVKPNAKPKLVWSRVHDRDALRGGLILLDEHSTISDEIGRDIVDTGARIIAAGDPGQLPPVSGRPFFTEPSATLKTIHRQALESGIIRQAHRVRAGHRYEADGPDFQVGSYAPDEIILGADVVLCWKNTTRHLLNARVRHLQGLDGMTPRRTETVMCLKNNGNFGVFNGATYELLEDYVPHSKRIVVDVDGFPTEIEHACFEGIDDQYHQYDNRNIRFTFGYSSTVHKFHGSEEQRVLLFDEYNASDDRDRWLYTGITRAQQTVIVIRA